MLREYPHYEYVTSKHIESTYYIIKESQRVVMSILCRAGYEERLLIKGNGNVNVH